MNILLLAETDPALQAAVDDLSEFSQLCVTLVVGMVAFFLGVYFLKKILAGNRVTIRDLY